MAIKFAAKEPAKTEAAKAAKKAEAKQPTTVASAKLDSEAHEDGADLFESDPKPTHPKAKGK